MRKDRNRKGKTLSGQNSCDEDTLLPNSSLLATLRGLMLWASQFRKNIEVLELVQGRATSLDHQSHEERLRELGFSLDKKRGSGLTLLFTTP